MFCRTKQKKKKTLQSAFIHNDSTLDAVPLCIGVSAESAFSLCLPDTYCPFSFLDSGGGNLSI